MANKQAKNKAGNTLPKRDRRKDNKLTPAMEANKWKPGISGNPGGRPKLLTDELRSLLRQKVPNDPQKRDYAKLFIQSILQRSITKSDVLAKEVFDRIEGKASMSDEDAARSSNAVSVIILDVPRPERPAINVPPIKKAIPAPTE